MCHSMIFVQHCMTYKPSATIWYPYRLIAIYDNTIGFIIVWKSLHCDMKELISVVQIGYNGVNPLPQGGCSITYIYPMCMHKG